MNALPPFWTDHRVIHCSVGARLLMQCLKDMAQDGRCVCTVRQLRSFAFAGRDDVSEADVELYLGELWSRALIEILSDHDIRLVDQWRPVAELLTEQTGTVGNG
jgi:hypothetical protein